MKLGWIGVLATVLMSGCPRADEPQPPAPPSPSVPTAWVVGHAPAVDKAVRLLGSQGLQTRTAAPVAEQGFVVFVVNSLDGPMLPTNIALEDVLPVPPERAAILRVDSALAPDPEIAELVQREMTELLLKKGQPQAKSFEWYVDDDGAQGLAARVRAR